MDTWLDDMFYKAYLSARQNKRKSRDEQRFEHHAEMYLAKLIEDVENRTYTPSKGIAFIVYEPVIREIFAAPFVDRVVHHVIFDGVGDWWDRRFIYDSYSCRKGKGTLFGARRLYHHIMSVSDNGRRLAYVLQLDLQGYFMSMERKRLYELVMWGLRRQFDKDSREYKLYEFLWRKTIFDDPTKGVERRGDLRGWDILPKNKSLFGQKKGYGIVIGNLTSQLLSNVLMDVLDRYVTMELGFKHYGRYVDDFFIVGRDREELSAAVPVIGDFLKRDLGLTMHPNKIVLQEASRGVAFLGTVVYPWRIQPGARVKRNAKMAVRNGDMRSVESYMGLMKHYKHHRMWGEFFEMGAS